MRFALVSDIHGNLPALEAVAEDIRRLAVDQVINLGDIASGPLLPRETVQWLQATDWLHLAGNHERQVLHFDPERGGEASDAYAAAQLGTAELDWLRRLQPWMRVNEALFCCHATPRTDGHYWLESVDEQGLRPATEAEIRRRLADERSEVFACGHTHVPRALRLDGQLIVNPGSVGLQAYVDDGERRPHRVENGAPDARYAVVERLPQGWRASLRTVPYDFEPMARLAERNGRADWALALRTGRTR